MRLYLSGPITGYPDLNKPAFAEAAAALRADGHDVLNPHEIGQASELLLPWEDYLRADLVAMLQQADGLAMLPAWERSRGARLEHHVATALGWEVRPWDSWLYTPSHRHTEN